jgi:hypothetical protein
MSDEGTSKQQKRRAKPSAARLPTCDHSGGHELGDEGNRTQETRMSASFRSHYYPMTTLPVRTRIMQPKITTLMRIKTAMTNQ